MKVDSSDERFQPACRVAASPRPDWSDDRRERALYRALIEKHGLLGVDERLLLPWESVMLATAHLELSVEDPWLVRPLWVALLGEEPEVCGQCTGPCESRFARCWGTTEPRSIARNAAPHPPTYRALAEGRPSRQAQGNGVRETGWYGHGEPVWQAESRGCARESKDR